MNYILAPGPLRQGLSLCSSHLLNRSDWPQTDHLLPQSQVLGDSKRGAPCPASATFSKKGLWVSLECLLLSSSNFVESTAASQRDWGGKRGVSILEPRLQLYVFYVCARSALLPGSWWRNMNLKQGEQKMAQLRFFFFKKSMPEQQKEGFCSNDTQLITLHLMLPSKKSTKRNNNT